MLIPKNGTKERIFLDACIANPKGVTYLDFVGTGITEENIEQIAENLRKGMFDAENDCSLKFDD